jgi:putative spermidine/putrescine transport system substrate-binding protein
MERRELLKRGAALALGAPYVITARSQETLIVNTQGGEYQELVERVVIRPFEKKFGVKVIHDATGTASQDYAKIRAARGAPGFDVAGLLTPPEVILGMKEGLLEKLTEREVPNLKYLWDKTWSVIPPGSGAPHTLQYAALVYNKDKIERPRSWADYWEPHKRYGDKIKGHVINYNPANLLSVYALLHAAQLGGGGADNMEPAWQRLKAQKALCRRGRHRLRRGRAALRERPGVDLALLERPLGLLHRPRPAVRDVDSPGRRNRPDRRRLHSNRRQEQEARVRVP